jgi:hypothetical protein
VIEEIEKGSKDREGRVKKALICYFGSVEERWSPFLVGDNSAEKVNQASLKGNSLQV